MGTKDKKLIPHFDLFLTIPVIVICLCINIIFAQTLREDLWIPNGAVSSITTADGIIYLGGTFTQVGPKIPGFAAIDTGTAESVPLLPSADLPGIRAIVPDGSGGWYVGGYSRLTMDGYLAHLHSDGTVDAWSTEIDGIVESLLVNDSTIFIGGAFRNIDGQVRNYIAAFNRATGELTAWNPDLNNYVYAMALSGSRLYIGGRFTTVGGQTRNHLAAIDTRTGLPTSWNPDANESVWALLIADSLIYIGGGFSTIGGQTRNYIAAIDSASAEVTAWDPNADGYVFSLAISDSIIYAGGIFNRIGGAARNCMAAIDLYSGNVTPWNPNFDNEVTTIAVSGSTIYTGGKFTSVGGQLRYYIAAIDAATGSPTPWHPAANNGVEELAVSGPNVYAGGGFNSIGAYLRSNVAAIDSASGRATDWNPGANGEVRRILISDSIIYLGGIFTAISGEPRGCLAAVEKATGNLTSWNPDANDVVWSMVMAGTNILAGGHFTTIGGQARNRLAAFDKETGIITDWDPGADAVIIDLAVSDQTVYVGGAFTTIGGQARNRLAAIDMTTGQVTDWNPNANDNVWDISISDAVVYTVGHFTNMGGITRSRTAAFDASTGNLTNWNPGANDDVQSISVSGSSAYLCGRFLSIGGQTRNRIAAVDVITGEVQNWNPDADNYLNVVRSSGSTVYLGGGFNNIRNTLQPKFAGISAYEDIPANPIVSFSADTLHFPQMPINESDSRSIMVYNTGTSDLFVTSAEIRGENESEFAITEVDVPATIIPGDSQQVAVQFSPVSEGSKTAYLIIGSDAPSSPDTLVIEGSAFITNGWYEQNSGVTDYLWNVHFTDNQNGWAVGDLGVVLHTTDGGTTWLREDIGAWSTLYDVYFFDNLSGWIAGQQGQLFRTTDGGDTWTLQDIGTTVTLSEVFFINQQTGWIVGPRDSLFHTTDGGNSWDIQNSTVTYALNSICFVDAQTGWAAGEHGTVVKTTDGGTNWVLQPFANTSSFYSVHFFDQQTGLTAGNNGTILRTTDGGSLWISQASGTTTSLRSLFFTTPQTGWASGGNDVILYTEDGGINWTPQDIGIVQGYECIFFSDPVTGWAVGGSGTILHTTDAGGHIQAATAGFSSTYVHFPNTPVYESSEETIALYNSSTGNLEISSKILTGSDASNFTIILGEGSSTIAPGDSEIISIRFSPTSSSMKTAEMVILSNAESSPDTIRLVGNDGMGVQVTDTPCCKTTIEMTVSPPRNFIPVISMLYYRQAGELVWHDGILNPSGDTFMAQIDSGFSTIRGIEYYIYFRDHDQNVITIPALNPARFPSTLQIQVNQITTETMLPAEKYKMISVPLELSNGDPLALFNDDYGEYDKKQWRLLHWNHLQEAYDEYPSLQASFFPGYACWLITRSGLPFDIENGLSVHSDSSISLTVQPGWNQIANPFAFTIAWDSVSNSTLLNAPVYWNGDDYDYTRTDLEPWEGYFVYNDSSEVVEIAFPPRESGSHLPKPSILTAVSPPEFLLQITAEGVSSGDRDEQNFVGMLESAKDGFDRTDFPQAPAIIDKTELSIVQEGRLYAGNFKSVSTDGAFWDMLMTATGADDIVEIELYQPNNIPENFEIWLLDKNRLSAIELNENRTRIDLRDSESAYPVRLIIGTLQYALKVNQGIPLEPLTFELRQNYPNPFNPKTIIEYQLPERVPVKINIYNVLGQKIKTLVNTIQSTGSYQVPWDGTNDKGIILGSGIFFYRIEAGAYAQTRKLLILR